MYNRVVLIFTFNPCEHRETWEKRRVKKSCKQPICHLVYILISVLEHPYPVYIYQLLEVSQETQRWIRLLYNSPRITLSYHRTYTKKKRPIDTSLSYTIYIHIHVYLIYHQTRSCFQQTTTTKKRTKQTKKKKSFFFLQVLYCFLI